MSMNFGGINSGLPVNDIIANLISLERRPIQLIEQQKAKISTQQGMYSNVQSRVQDLYNAITRLTERSFTGTGIFDAMAASSSDEKVATATVIGDAQPQTLELEIKTLPSQTRASSTAGVGRFDAATLLSDLGVTSGSFTVFVNGNARQITVDDSEDLGTVLSRLASDLSGGGTTFNAGIVDGKIQLTHDGPPETTVQFGAGGDNSNFLARTHLLTALNDGAGTITASQRGSIIKLQEGVSSGAANLATPVTDGTFSINGVTFSTLKEDGVTSKSMTELMNEINGNANAKVTASFNMGSNTFELRSKETGSAMISLGDSSNGGGTSNFLSAMNVISAGDMTVSQTAGTNAEFVLNGVTMYATSNVVDETVHGMTGVTLNLKQAQPGNTVQINIQKDQANLKEAIRDVIKKYNDAIDYIDQQTKAGTPAGTGQAAVAGGPLSSERSLIALRNQIRGMFSTSVAALAGTPYDSLQQVGIGTAVTAGGNASPRLQFDEAKFDAAMAADPETVKKLFAGQDLYDDLDGGLGDDNMRGVFTQLKELLSDKTYALPGGRTGYGALYSSGAETGNGLFASWSRSAGTRVADMNKSIERAEERLLRKEQMLRQQFTAMDRMVGQFQSQGNALNGLISQLSSLR